ncbi:MAG: SDR family NAD(P)-dependent oxidoreductase [Candidatus Dormibacteraceae bacterium]
MSEGIRGRTAVVTGAGRGIGRAIAIGLAAQGVQVALVARTDAELQEVATRVKSAGGRALAVPLDVTDQGAAIAATREIAERLGPVDILINNAAVVWPLGPSVAVDAAQWSAAIAINVVAVATLSLSLLPSMIDRGWGRIVNLSSGVAAHPSGMLGGNAYVTSKAAVEAHTLNLAAEVAGSGATVNAYRPGGVDTAMQAWIRDQGPQRVGAALHDRFARSYAEGSLLTPERSAASLLARLPGAETGHIWDVSDPL